MKKHLFRGFHPFNDIELEKAPTTIEKIYINGKWIEGRWVCGDGIHYPKSINYAGTCWIDGMRERANDWIPVIPETVGEFTGKHDVKGKEIFENDVCKDTVDDIIQVVWQETHCSWGCKIIKTDCTLSRNLTFPLWQWNDLKENGYRQLEVIGTIYDDPTYSE